MALKKKLTKNAYDNADEAVKLLYKESNGSYVLDLEGDDDNDVDELRRAKDRETQAARDLRKQLKEAQEQLAELNGNDARKRGDVEALEKSWKEKLERREQELSQTLAKKDGFIKQMLVQDRAEALATKISNAPALMRRVIQERLLVELDGDEPQLRVLDKDGKPSAMTLADLEKEMVANPEYAPIVIGSKATGGGAGTGSRQGSSGADPNGTGNAVDVAAMTPEQHVARLRAAREQRQ